MARDRLSRERRRGAEMTGSAGRRAAQAARRREELLEIAFRLFATRGYRGTSVRDITHAAGVTEGTLYVHFPGKSDLLRAVLERYAPFAAYDAAIGATASLPAAELLIRLATGFLAVLRERRTFVLTLLAEAPVDPELAATLTEFLGRAVEQLAGALRQRQAAGEIDASVDVEAVAIALQGSVLLHFLATGLSPGWTPDATVDGTAVRRLVELLERLIPAQPADQ